MFNHFSFMYVHVHGGGFSRMVNVMAASSSSVGGSGTLHMDIHIQIGEEMPKLEKSPHDVALV